MTKLIGYARVSTRQQSTDRQQADLLAAGVRRDDPYIERWSPLRSPGPSRAANPTNPLTRGRQPKEQP